MESEFFKKHGKIYDEGKVIFNEGDYGKEMFIIVEGKVKIVKKVGNIEKVLMVLDKGDFFGEMALVEDKPRSASAIALTTCKLIVIDKNLLKSLIMRNPEFAYKMIIKMSQRIRETNKQIEEMIKYDAKTRIINELVKSLTEKNYKEFSKLIEDVSGFVGVSKEEVSQTIRELVSSGVITLRGGMISFNKDEMYKISKFLNISRPKYELY
ncbi:MAG: Crp/Fnr family transcriptional regulator [Brevinematia bacterium]